MIFDFRYLILGFFGDYLRKEIKWLFSSHGMFVMIADVKLKDGAEDDFKSWFSESNKVLSVFPGFQSRKFLKSTDGKRPLSKCTIVLNMINFILKDILT